MCRKPKGLISKPFPCYSTMGCMLWLLLGFTLKANWNEVFSLTFGDRKADVFESENFPNTCELVIYQAVPLKNGI